MKKKSIFISKYKILSLMLLSMGSLTIANNDYTIHNTPKSYSPELLIELFSNNPPISTLPQFELSPNREFSSVYFFGDGNSDPGSAHNGYSRPDEGNYKGLNFIEDRLTSLATKPVEKALELPFTPIGMVVSIVAGLPTLIMEGPLTLIQPFWTMIVENGADIAVDWVEAGFGYATGTPINFIAETISHSIKRFLNKNKRSNDLYTDILTQYYARTNGSYSPLKGGTNYAKIHTNINDTIRTINQFLVTNENQIDQSALYFIWTGQNDIIHKTFIDQSLVLDKAAGLANTTQALLDAGAPHVFFGNNYDVSLTPGLGSTIGFMAHQVKMGYVNTIPSLVIDLAIAPIKNTIKNAIGIPIGFLPGPIAFFIKIPISIALNIAFGIPSAIVKIPVNLVWKTLTKAIDEKIQHMILPPNKVFTGRDGVREHNIMYLKSQFPFIPKFVFSALIDLEMKTLANDTIIQNQAILNELNRVNGDIVYLDFYSLVNEIVEDPIFYGFASVGGSVCKPFDLKEAFFNFSSDCSDDKLLLFRDAYRPSVALSQLFSQYIISVFDAPLKVGSLSSVAENIHDSNDLFISNHLRLARFMNPALKMIPIVGFTTNSGTRGEDHYDHLKGNKTSGMTSLNAGFLYRIHNNFLIGSVVSLGKGHAKPYHDYYLKYNSQKISLLGQFTHPVGYWAALIMDVSRIKAKNINRYIQLGMANYSEIGETRATVTSTKIVTGFDFKIREHITATPILSFETERNKVNGYREHGDRSTAMHFDKQKRISNIAAIGFQVNSKNVAVKGTNIFLNPSIEVTYNRYGKRDPIEVRGAVNNAGDTSFARKINLPKKNWVAVKLGLATKLSPCATGNCLKNLEVVTAVEYKSLTQNRWNFALGLQSNF